MWQTCKKCGKRCKGYMVRTDRDPFPALGPYCLRCGKLELKKQGKGFVLQKIGSPYRQTAMNLTIGEAES